MKILFRRWIENANNQCILLFKYTFKIIKQDVRRKATKLNQNMKQVYYFDENLINKTHI